MNASPKYPVVFLYEGYTLCYRSPAVLQKCDENLIDNGYMIGGVIIDSDGRQFIVKGVVKIRNLNWLPWFLLPYRWRTVAVEFELSELERLTIGEFKLLMADLGRGKRGTPLENKFREQMFKGSETYSDIMDSTGGVSY